MKKMKEMHEESGELQELKHDPVPGYRTALLIALLIGTAYLALIFFAVK